MYIIFFKKGEVVSKLKSFTVYRIEVDGSEIEIKTPIIFDPKKLIRAVEMIASRESYFDDNSY